MLDRRADERTAVDATASIRWVDNGIERECVALSPRDVSPAGAYLPHRAPPPVGIKGQLEVVVHSKTLARLTGTAQLVVQTEIEVIRSEANGFAVRFNPCSHRVDLATGFTFDGAPCADLGAVI